MNALPTFVKGLASRHLNAAGSTFLDEACAEIAGGVDSTRFSLLISMASRYARGKGEVSEDERAQAEELLPGWNPERWTPLESARVALILARTDWHAPEAAQALKDAFEFGDEGELRALYKSLPLLPDAGRFTWQAGEGCRTNIVPVFEAVACDNPLPLEYFDDVAWNQMCIKALFIGAPLWRVYGLDQRLSPELARMALDLVEERRSAGREIQPELWLCLGEHEGERGRSALREEIQINASVLSRRAALIGLARANDDASISELAHADDRTFLEEHLGSSPSSSVFGTLFAEAN